MNRIFLGLLLILADAECAEGDRPRQLVALIKNADIDFQGEYPGIVAYVSGASEEVRQIGEPAAAFLEEALFDGERYVIVDRFGPVTPQSVRDQREKIMKVWAARKPNKSPEHNALPQQ